MQRNLFFESEPHLMTDRRRRDVEPIRAGSESPPESTTATKTQPSECSATHRAPPAGIGKKLTLSEPAILSAAHAALHSVEKTTA